MEDIKFNTTNEGKEYSKPLITSGQYEFKIAEVRPSDDKSKNFFILDIVGQVFEEKQVSLIWSAPINDEYTPNTNVGKLFKSVGIELGNQVSSSALIGLSGKCIVNDYTKQVSGKVVTYSVIGDLIIPEVKEEPTQVDTEDSGIQEDSTM